MNHKHIFVNSTLDPDPDPRRIQNLTDPGPDPAGSADPGPDPGTRTSLVLYVLINGNPGNRSKESDYRCNRCNP